VFGFVAPIGVRAHAYVIATWRAARLIDGMADATVRVEVAGAAQFDIKRLLQALGGGS